MALWISLWLWGCDSAKSSADSGAEPASEDTTDTNADTDTGDPIEELDCDALLWTYDNVGAPFMTTWCTSCHSSSLEEAYRAGAPVSVNFDTQADVQSWIPNILNRIYNETTPMPPIGAPPEDELQRVADWLRCDAP